MQEKHTVQLGLASSTLLIRLGHSRSLSVAGNRKMQFKLHEDGEKKKEFNGS